MTAHQVKVAAVGKSTVIATSCALASLPYQPPGTMLDALKVDPTVVKEEAERPGSGTGSSTVVGRGLATTM